MSNESSKRKSFRLQNLPAVEADIVGVVSLSTIGESKLYKDALFLLPQARSVLVFAMEVFPEILNHTRPETVMGTASLNDLMVNNNSFVSSRLTKSAYDIAKFFRKNGFGAVPLPSQGCPRDGRFLEAVLSYKHAAKASGIGYIGWNGLILTPDYGPRLRLSCCITEAIVESTLAVGEVSVSCKQCGLCINSCPAKALSVPDGKVPYVMDKFACSVFRSACGGCWECMRVCPVGK